MKGLTTPHAVLLVQPGGSPSPQFEPVQRDLLAAGGAFVNAAVDYDGD